MKCPKCNISGFKFIHKRIKGIKSTGNTEGRWSKRKSNLCKCNKCGYEENVE